MIYHSHVGDPRMVPGRPSASDERDDLMLLEEGANFDRKLLCYPRVVWVPLLRLLREIEENGKRLSTD